MSKFPERVFSGMQPTSALHLGNYLGAMVNWIRMQETHDCLYCVVDLHAMTIFQEPKDLTENTRGVTAAYLACGLDPKRSIIFNQSQVPEHAELAWIFNCVARLGWLNRMTQFKEKAGKDRENASIGLYDYPVLMAADILAYQGTHVPVGEDQKQHLELARDIAQKFNNDFAESIAAHGHGEAFFPLPEPMITGPATRVMSLRDGTKKMSKSDASDNSRINLTDDADTIAQKIRKAKTDPDPLPSEVKGLGGPPGGGEPRRNLCGARRHHARRGAEGFRRRAVLDLQAGAFGAGGGEARADRGGDAAAPRRPGSHRPCACRRRRAGARHRASDRQRSEGCRRAAQDPVTVIPSYAACPNPTVLPTRSLSRFAPPAVTRSGAWPRLAPP